MKHKLEHIQDLKEVLARLPPVEPQASELTTQEAVKLLRPEVASLQRKGYSFEMIAQVLGANGFAVTASTLKKYRSIRKQDSTRKVGKKNHTAEVASAPTKPGNQTVAATRRTRQSGKNESVHPRAGEFTPREDTRDI